MLEQNLYGFLLQISRALFADVAPLEERYVIYTAIALCDAKRAAQLDRYDDTTEFVDFSDDSCGFHSYLLLRSRPANCGEIVIQRAKAELSDYYRFTVFAWRNIFCPKMYTFSFAYSIAFSRECFK